MKEDFEEIGKVRVDFDDSSKFSLIAPTNRVSTFLAKNRLTGLIESDAPAVEAKVEFAIPERLDKSRASFAKELRELAAELEAAESEQFHSIENFLEDAQDFIKDED